MNWSGRYPGLQTRPANLQSSPPLLSPGGEETVDQIGLRSLQTPCELLEERDGVSEVGGVGTPVTIVVAVTLCDIEPYRTSDAAPPAGFENERLYYVYLSRQIAVNLSARIRVPGWLPQWQADHPYAPGDKVVPTSDAGNGHFYEALVAGQSGSSEPVWDERKGAQFGDGAVTWQEAGDAFTLEIANHDGQRSSQSLICVLCKVLK